MKEPTNTILTKVGIFALFLSPVSELLFAWDSQRMSNKNKDLFAKKHAAESTHTLFNVTLLENTIWYPLGGYTRKVCDAGQFCFARPR